MPRKHIQNDAPRTIFVGGVMIPPGECREVDTTYLPPEYQDDAPAAKAPASTEPDPDANLRELLKGTVKDITAQLEGFSAETLKRLGELEGASETPRATLLGAITAQQLKLAAGTAGAPT